MACILPEWLPEILPEASSTDDAYSAAVNMGIATVAALS
jgi:hypothetical protein